MCKSRTASLTEATVLDHIGRQVGLLPHERPDWTQDLRVQDLEKGGVMKDYSNPTPETRTWLKWRARDAGRKNRRFPILWEEESEETSLTSPSAESVYERKELLTIIETALEELPDDWRIIWEWRELAGYSHTVIALALTELTGKTVTPAAVRKRYSRATQCLRQILRGLDML